MDKNNTEAHRPCANLNFFQLTYLYCVTIVSAYSTMNIRGQEKDEKDPKMVSCLPRFIDLF